MKKRKQLKHWSYSSWAMFKLCPHRWMRRYILGEREPEGAALAKGNKYHALAERFLKFPKTKLPSQLKHLRVEYNHLRDHRPIAEQLWHFDRDLQPCKQWGWLLVKMDAVIKPCIDLKKWLFIQDLKTGMDYPTHKDQGSIYAATGANKFPRAKGVEVEMWYSDTGLVWPMVFTMEKIRKLQKFWIKQGETMFAMKKYPKTPSDEACRWCPLRSDRGGGCNAWRSVH